MQFFATCARGLEPLLAAELAAPAIRAKKIREGSSGVYFSGTLETGYRANLWLRTAVRVLAQIGRAPTPGPDELYDWVRDLPWEQRMSVEQTLSVDARVWDSNITHSRYAAFRVKDAICDRFRDRVGSRPDVDPQAADLPLFLHIFKNHASLYRDLSGQSLHKRGYRSAMHKSSLNECVGAAMVLHAGWTGEVDLCDPMCGSGTIAIEAALIALHRAPGLMRRAPFPFESWPDFDRKQWGELRTEAKDLARASFRGRILANDVHPGAVALCRGDVSRAKLDASGLHVTEGNAEHFAPERTPAVVITNPPWGERLTEESETSWRELGRFLKRRAPGATAWILSGNPELTRFLGLKASRRYPLSLSRVDCRIIRYDIRGADDRDAPRRAKRREADERR